MLIIVAFTLRLCLLVARIRKLSGTTRNRKRSIVCRMHEARHYDGCTLALLVFKFSVLRGKIPVDNALTDINQQLSDHFVIRFLVELGTSDHSE